MIRRAVPGDSADIARLMYVAGQGHLRISIYDLIVPGPEGPTPERLGCLERVLTSETRSWFHHSYYHVAEVGGRVAGSICGFNKEEGRGRGMVAALKEAGLTEEDFVEMGERLQPVIRVEPRIPNDVWVIENVATRPGLRRRGITSALLEHVIEEGVERDYRQTQITCVKGNDPAIRAYEKVGFQVVEELLDSEFERVFGAPGMVKMVLER